MKNTYRRGHSNFDQSCVLLTYISAGLFHLTELSHFPTTVYANAEGVLQLFRMGLRSGGPGVGAAEPGGIITPDSVFDGEAGQR